MLLFIELICIPKLVHIILFMFHSTDSMASVKHVKHQARLSSISLI